MQVPLLWASIQTNVIGELAAFDSMTDENEWFENVRDIEPSNLYEAQLGRRICGDDFDACNRGVFDAEAGVCVQEPRKDGTPCDGGDPDEQGRVCRAGICASSGNGGGDDGCSVSAPGQPGSAWLVLVAALVLGGRARRDRGEDATGRRPLADRALRRAARRGSTRRASVLCATP
ncbi:hypothetical protein ACMHYB_08845 [Sorangium sp. So ce1128]